MSRRFHYRSSETVSQAPASQWDISHVLARRPPVFVRTFTNSYSDQGSPAVESVSNVSSTRIPEATVARLPVYLRALNAMSDAGTTTCSSLELATAAGVNSAKLRKDLSHLGSYGTRGVGYDVAYLRYQISREIGLTQDWPVVVVGIGNLGHALANYSGFSSRGFRTVALLDADGSRHGELVAGLEIRPFEDLRQVVADHGVGIGVIATPAIAAQAVADRMVECGIRSVLNFAPTILSVPEGVDVRRVDLSSELQILAYHEQRKNADAAPAPIVEAG